MKESIPVVLALVAAGAGASFAQSAPLAGDAALGSAAYELYDPPKICSTCHVDISRQHEQAMMSQAYTHAWDEIEYFRLAVPHAEKEPKVAGVRAGCNGCHAPVAFLAGDVPPPAPAEGSRANESVSCDLCHTVRGFEGEGPILATLPSRGSSRSARSSRRAASGCPIPPRSRRAPSGRPGIRS